MTPRGRHELRQTINEHFNLFALALDKHVPYFSNKVSPKLTGPVQPQATERARQYLLPRLVAPGPARDGVGPAIEMLRQILVGTPIVSPETRKQLGDW
jgi:hypothetical protein